MHSYEQVQGVNEHATSDERLEAVFGAVPPQQLGLPAAVSQPLYADSKLKGIIKRISDGDRNSAFLLRNFIAPWQAEQSSRWHSDDIFATTVANFVNRAQSKTAIDPNNRAHRDEPLDVILSFVSLRGHEITLEERHRLDTQTKKAQWRPPDSHAARRPPLPKSTYSPATDAEAVSALAALPRGYVRAVTQAYGAEVLSDRSHPLYSVPDVQSAQMLAKIITGGEAPLYGLPRDNELNRTLTPVLRDQPRVLLIDCIGQRVPASLTRLATASTFSGRPAHGTPITVPLQAVVIILVGAKSFAPDIEPLVVKIPSADAAIDVDKVRGAVSHLILCGVGADPFERVQSALPPEEAAVQHARDGRKDAVERYLQLAHAAFGDKSTPIGKAPPPLLMEAPQCCSITTHVELYLCNKDALVGLGLGDDPTQWPRLLGTLLSDLPPTYTLTRTAATLTQTAPDRPTIYQIRKTRPKNVVHYAVYPVVHAVDLAADKTVEQPLALPNPHE